MPSSIDYWRDREEAQRQKNITDELAYNREIEKIHSRMIKSIQDRINAFYTRYANSEGLTLAEAKKKVAAFDVEAFSEKAARYVKNKDFSKRANEELRLYNATMRINRLELLKSEIGLDMVDGYDELEKLFGEKLTERSLEEFRRQAGILGNSVVNPEKLAHSIVNASFHNATFSDRVWAHHDILKSDLDKLLSQALIQGLNPRALISNVLPNIGDTVKNRRYAAMRLLTTELCRVQIDAQMKSYERNGYDSYRYLAEPTACPHCKALDDKTFKLDKISIGENAPPLHPSCRCSTAAAVDEDEYERWFYKKTGQHSAGWEGKDSVDNFKPAQTIESAQEYASKFFKEEFMDRTFKGEADYKGISLEHANEINKTLEEIFGDLDIPQLSGIKAISGSSKQGKSVFSDSDAIAAYDPIQQGIYLNKDILKDKKSLEAYTKRANEAFDFVMANMDKLSGAQKETALAYKRAGRSLVDAGSVRGAVTHEVGHHVQWTALDAKANNLLGERMGEYAPKLSGYANANKSEYMAESFSAFRKGETKILDPEYVKALSNLRANPNGAQKTPAISRLSNQEIRNLKGAAILQERVDSGKISMTVNTQKQDRHMREDKVNKNSYLTISLDEVQDIVNDRTLYKDFYLNDDDRQIKAIVECNKRIGFVYDELTGKKIPTNRATIHFSKTGTHLVPTGGDGL